MQPSRIRPRTRRFVGRGAATVVLGAAMTLTLAGAQGVGASGRGSPGGPLAGGGCGNGRPVVGPLPAQLDPLQVGRPLTGAERNKLCSIAASTWRFFSVDVDPNTHLP